MTIEPTPKLRFVERKEDDFTELYEGHVRRTYKVRRILQQWWRDVQTGEGGWRDVPLEAE